MYDIPPNISLLRRTVLLEAQSWLGTPFAHLQRCKGAGVDCGQFLIGVFHNAGLIPNIKTEYYPRDFHLHRDREWYKELVLEFSDEIQPPPLPGDVVLYRIGRVHSHGGIVFNWPILIHSYVTNGVSYVDAGQGLLRTHNKKFFQPKMLGKGVVP